LLKGRKTALWSSLSRGKLMHHYEAEQKTISIGDIRIGGRPGLVPTTMIGSIFYTKDKLVINAREGKADKQETEAMVRQLEEISEKTGLPSVLDVIAQTPKAMKEYIRLVADMTEMPLMIDGSGSEEVNLAGLRAAEEIGAMGRVILNSIGPEDDKARIERYRDAGLETAMLLAFSSGAMASSTKRVELAEILIQRTSEAGIENLIVDTGVVDLLTLGLACKAISSIKSRTGTPTGCGAHNAVNMWSGLVPKFGKDAKMPAQVGCNLVPVVLGADFVLYGPIKHAPVVFPSVAMVDVALSGSLLEEGLRPDKSHPRFRIG
jgi:tetrahydromethanopterin S-methyltransferase subunit H